MLILPTRLNVMRHGRGEHLEDVSIAEPSKVYRGIIVGIATSILIHTLVLSPASPNVALSQAMLNIVSDFAVIAVPICVRKVSGKKSLLIFFLVGEDFICLGT